MNSNRSEKPSEKSRRSLILLSKVLQNLANSVEFGEKEAYMLKTNPFIMSNQKGMFEFLDALGVRNILYWRSLSTQMMSHTCKVISEDVASQQMVSNISEETLEKGLDTIATFLKRLSEKIRKALGDEKKKQHEDMMAALEEYQKVAVEVKDYRKKNPPPPPTGNFR
jgi:hypothetical protein